ncbi:hypothetical protein D3C79_1003980 [compost metagenome]
MQNLHLALRAVASVQADRTIPGIEPAFGRAALQRLQRGADDGAIFQLQHVVLNGVQYVVRRDIYKCENLLRGFYLREQKVMVAPQLAP